MLDAHAVDNLDKRGLQMIVDGIVHIVAVGLQLLGDVGYLEVGHEVELLLLHDQQEFFGQGLGRLFGDDLLVAGGGASLGGVLTDGLYVVLEDTLGEVAAVAVVAEGEEQQGEDDGEEIKQVGVGDEQGLAQHAEHHREEGGEEHHPHEGCL